MGYLYRLVEFDVVATLIGLFKCLPTSGENRKKYQFTFFVIIHSFPKTYFISIFKMIQTVIKSEKLSKYLLLIVGLFQKTKYCFD